MRMSHKVPSKMEMETAVWCFLSVLTPAAISQGVAYRTPLLCPLDHVYSTPEMNDHQNLYALSEGQCLTLCEDTKDCTAYNYEDRLDSVCELNSERAGGEASVLIAQDGFIYMEKIEDGKEPTSCQRNSDSQRDLVSFESVALTSTKMFASCVWWGKDTLDTLDRTYFVGSPSASVVKEFPTEGDCINNTRGITHTINGETASGTNHLVYGRRFFYRVSGTSDINVFDLNTDKLSGQITDLTAVGSYYASYENYRCTYSPGTSTTYMFIDLEADESGVWIIWGRENDDCGLSISKVDINTLTIMRSWHTPVQKMDLSNTFAAFGILYGLESPSVGPTFIRFSFNTQTEELIQHACNHSSISLPVRPTSLSFNLRDGKVYASNNNDVCHKFNVTFSDI